MHYGEKGLPEIRVVNVEAVSSLKIKSLSFLSSRNMRFRRALTDFNRTSECIDLAS